MTAAVTAAECHANTKGAMNSDLGLRVLSHRRDRSYSGHAKGRDAHSLARGRVHGEGWKEEKAGTRRGFTLQPAVGKLSVSHLLVDHYLQC